MKKDALRLKDGRFYRAFFNTRVLVYICFHSSQLLLHFKENCTLEVKSLAREESVTVSMCTSVPDNLCSKLENREVGSYTARGKIDLCPDLLLLVSEEQPA